MTVKQHRIPTQRTVIDLTRVPYFAPEPAPLTLREASGLERVRDAADELLALPDYRVHRQPRPADESMRFGGLGLAAVMDVGAHPIRARARRINVLQVVAISVIAAVAIVMITMAATMHP